MTWIVVWEFLKGVFGNRYVQLLLVAVLLAGGGYAFGRWGQPPKVVVQTKIETVTKDRIVFQDKVVVKTVYVKDKKEDKHVETTTEKRPDGTVVTKTTSDTKTNTDTKINTDKTDEKYTTKDRIVEKTVIETKTVESKKLDWRVAVGAGYSIPTALGQQQIGTPGLKGAVIQLELSRRLWGPIFLDAFGNTQGTVGGGLSAVF